MLQAVLMHRREIRSSLSGFRRYLPSSERMLEGSSGLPITVTGPLSRVLYEFDSCRSCRTDMNTFPRVIGQSAFRTELKNSLSAARGFAFSRIFFTIFRSSTTSKRFICNLKKRRHHEIYQKQSSALMFMHHS